LLKRFTSISRRRCRSQTISDIYRLLEAHDSWYKREFI